MEVDARQHAQMVCIRQTIPATSANNMSYRWSRDQAIVDLIRQAGPLYEGTSTCN